MAAIEQHRRPTVRGGQLKPPGRSLIGRLDLGDDASKRSVAQTIFGKRQHLIVVAPVGVEDLLGAEPHLLKARRVKIEAAHCPEHCEPRLRRKARCDSGGEQSRRRVIIECRGGGRDFVKAGTLEAPAC